MYYFDLGALSSFEWRVTHGLSHHLYTNTLYDFEISVLEPFIYYLPDPNKSTLLKMTSMGFSHIILALAFPIETVKRIMGIILGYRKFRWENLFFPLELLLMIFAAGNTEMAIR